MDQPLLRSSITHNPPPRHVFQIRSRTETEDSSSDVWGSPGLGGSNMNNATNNNNASWTNNGRLWRRNGCGCPPTNHHLADGRERDEQQQWKEDNEEYNQIFGRPYARNTLFWFRDVPLAMVLGIVVGTTSIGFVGVTETITNMWLPVPSIADSQQKLGQIHWIWMSALLGGLATSGLLVVLTMHRNATHNNGDNEDDSNSRHWLFSLGQHSVMSAFNDEERDGNLRHFALGVLAGFVALVSGAPVGPEMVVGLIATTLGSITAELSVAFLSSSRTSNEVEVDHATMNHQPLQQEQQTTIIWMTQQRQRRKMIGIALAASVGPFVSSPIVGPILAGELAQLARSNRDPHVEGGEHFYDEGSLLGRHDHMEHFSLQLVASLTSSWLASAVHYLLGWKLLTTIQPISSEVQYEYDHWHLVVAVMVGIVCGIFSVLAQILSKGVRRWTLFISRRPSRGISSTTSNSVNGSRMLLLLPPSMLPLVFPILAAIVNALLSHVSPEIVGSGLNFIGETMTSISSNGTIEENDDTHDNTFMSQSTLSLVLAATTKLVAASLSTNLGLVGGSTTPMVFAGCCLGSALGSIGGCPPLLTFVCAIVATPFTLCPFPASIALLTLTFLMPQSSCHGLIAPVVVSCSLSWLVVGGLGLPCILETTLLSSTADDNDIQGLLSANHGTHDGADAELDRDDQQHQEESQQQLNTEEMLQNIRRAIFGD